MSEVANSDYHHKQELIICGSIRSITVNDYDYNDIIAIIFSYYQQGFAKYFNEEIDTDYKEQMQFGDILQTQDDKYMVMDMNDELELVGKNDEVGLWDDDEFNIEIKIPLSICKHLSNAVSFYSKFDQRQPFRDAFIYTLKLCINNDDESIIQYLGGALSKKYKSIIMYSMNHSLDSMQIGIIEDQAEVFDVNRNKITCQDIDDFFEIRQPENSEKLVAIRVLKIDNKDAPNRTRFGRTERCREVPTILWSVKLNGIANCIDYVGPKNECDKMKNHLEEFHKKRNNSSLRVSVVDIKETRSLFSYPLRARVVKL